MKLHRTSAAIVPLVSMVAVIAIAAISASMFSTLRHRLRRHRTPDVAIDAEAAEREHVRRALEPITVKIDPGKYKRGLKPLPDDFDLAAFRRSMPVFDPPLSPAIIEERESNQY